MVADIDRVGGCVAHSHFLSCLLPSLSVSVAHWLCLMSLSCRDNNQKDMFIACVKEKQNSSELLSCPQSPKQLNKYSHTFPSVCSVSLLFFRCGIVSVLPECVFCGCIDLHKFMLKRVRMRSHVVLSF